MEKRKLEEYRSMKAEIFELEEKINGLYEDDTLYCNSTILNYNKGYPIPESVIGVDGEKYWRLRETYEKKVKELKKSCEEVEMFVESIPESSTRRIFRMRYIDGMNLKDVGAVLHRERSGIGKEIDAYLRQQDKKE